MITVKETRAKIGTGYIHIQKLSHKTPEPRPETLVFLHEALGSVKLWRDFPMEIAKRTGLDAIIYDRPGYGYSDPCEREWDMDYLHREATVILPELLKKLNIEKAVHVGHSDGGSIALIHAASFPERVSCMVAEAAHVYVDPVALSGIRETAEAFARTDLRERLSKYHGKKTDRVFGNWRDTWTSPWFRKWNITADLKKINCPVLVIQGEEDEYTAPDQWELICRGAELSEPAVIPGCRHVPHAQARERTAREMTSFIRKNIYGSR